MSIFKVNQRVPKLLLLILFYAQCNFAFAVLEKESKPRLMVDIGHTDWVNDVAYSPNGKLLATAGQDKKVIVWDVALKKILLVLPHKDFANKVAFSPEGKYLATADKSVHIWEISTGALINELSWSVYSSITLLSFSSDGLSLYSGTDQDYCSWDLKANQHRVSNYRSISSSVPAVNTRKGLIAIAKTDTDVEVRSIADDKVIYTFSNLPQPINNFAFTPDGHQLAIISTKYGEFGEVSLFDLSTGQQRFQKRISNTAVSAAIFSSDGKILYCGDYDNKVYIIDTQSGLITNTLTIKSWVKNLAIDEINENIALASHLSVESYNLRTRQFVGEYKGQFLRPGYDIYFTPDGKNLLTNQFLWSGVNSQLSKVVICEDMWYVGPYNYSITPDGKSSIVSTKNKTIKQWDLMTGKETALFTGLAGNAGLTAVNSKGNLFISLGEDNTISFWDITTGAKIKSFPAEAKNHTQLVYSPDEQFIAYTNGYNEVIVINATNGEKIHHFTNWGSLSCPVTISPNSKHIAGYSTDKKSIVIVDLSNGQVVKSFKPTTCYINSITFSPDGKTIACGTHDNIVQLWDVATGNELKQLKGHTTWVMKVSYSSDGKRIATGSYDGSSRIWDAQTLNELAQFYCFSNDSWIIVTPDGRFEAKGDAMQLVHYVQGLDLLPIESFFDKYYTPNLFAQILEGTQVWKQEVKENKDLNKGFALPPIVKIKNIHENQSVNSASLTVEVEATDQGGGIDEILLYLNGKLIETTQRGFKPVERKGEADVKTFALQLANGTNEIKATAFNIQRTESIPHVVQVNYAVDDSQQPNLYLVCIGINEYKNQKYNLQYAIPDADAFFNQMKKGAKSIFKRIDTKFIQNAEATRENILKTFGDIQLNARQQDVLIFYYAGHGVMSEEDEKFPVDFYLIPTDVTTLYGNNDMLKRKAISARELMDLSRKVKAQKQLFILDACQSGGAVETFASRGVAEEKAMMQLARSAGIALFAASNSDQYASEIKQLGHGVFTYSILEALKGKADGGYSDQKITISELRAYLDDNVPELTKQYRGQAQFPQCIMKGMDFPIVIVK